MNTISQYLKDAALLEGQRYTQAQIILKLKNQINTLGKSRYFKEPVLRTWKFELWGDNSFLLAPIICIIFIFQIFTKVFADDGGILVAVKDTLKYGLFLALIEIILRNIYTYIKYNTTIKKKYTQEIENYNSVVDADNRRVQHELILKRELERQVAQVEREKASTESTLNSLYSVGLVHPKYRNMVAISTFFDYFDTGICFSFTGPGGAYATYEENLRFQRLETKLDVIISKLDEIIESQRTLAGLMRDANNTLNRIEHSNSKMMQSMSNIEQNTELIEYTSRCAMQSSVVMEHIMVYNTLKCN